SHRPQFECLENRLAPANHIWTGAVSNLWSNNGNWNGGAPNTDTSGTPVALIFPTGASNLANTNDITNLIIASITYTGSGYMTTGNLLSFPSGGPPASITTDPTVTGADTFNAGIIFGIGTVTVNIANNGAMLTLGGVLSETSPS